MSSVQIEQKSYEMPREGMAIAHFLTVADIERSARLLRKRSSALAFGAWVRQRAAYLQLANIWMSLTLGRADRG